MTQIENTTLTDVEPDEDTRTAVPASPDDVADGPSDASTVGPIGRRGVLGAVAAGVFFAACGSSSEPVLDSLSSGAGTSGSSTPSLGAVANDFASASPSAAGVEVMLPTPAAATPASVAAASSSDIVAVESASGSTAASATGSVADPTGSSATATAAPQASESVMVVEDASTSPTPAPAQNAPDPATPPAPVTPVANGALIDLVVSRLTYGYTPGMQASVASVGPDAFIDDQLSKTTPDPAAESLASAIEGIADDTFVYIGGRKAEASHLRKLGMSSLVRATNSDHQLFEVMSHFWADHFNINAEPTELKSLNLARHYQEFVIRPNAMGKFRDLLQAVIHSPGMLEYLDQVTSDANSAEGVNENLGREILELHTLGIDENEDLSYSETDVQQASLALAGLTYSGNARNARNGGYYKQVFQPKFAYTGEISLLGGQWTNAGLSGEDVAKSMVSFLANHPQTARYVAYKLCRRFVADFPPISLVESAAKVFQDNDTDIVSTLSHIFKSDEFAQSSYQKYRRPFEFNVAAIRALGSSVSNDTDEVNTKLLAFITKLGHHPWQHLTPDGFPDVAIEWINSGGMQERWNFAGNLTRNETPIKVDKARYMPAVETVDAFINELAAQIGIGALESSDRAAIATAGGVTGADSATELSDDQIARMTGLVLSHPLFQTR